MIIPQLMNALVVRSIVARPEEKSINRIIDSILCGHYAPHLTKEITREQLKQMAMRSAQGICNVNYELPMSSFYNRFTFDAAYFNEEFLEIMRNLPEHERHFLTHADIFSPNSIKDGTYYVLKSIIKERIKQGFGLSVIKKTDHFHFSFGQRLPPPAN
ncbi:MAG: hypothetical protein BWZ03_00606 [bacterium ADurb.BinA186]|nr:MAG: hypothetical protein BWZ03_00606 [bacterium ADurb.BinA186]